MGYTLKIGEAVLDWNEDYVRVTCEPERHDSAPAFGEPTDYTNQRWPSYSAWKESMDMLGLSPLMESELEYRDGYLTPLLSCHPGVAPITAGHVSYIEEALARFQEKHGPVIPGYDGSEVAGVLVRGVWLHYWCKWAVENCQHPVFVNS